MDEKLKNLLPAPPPCRAPPMLVDRRGLAATLWRVLTSVPAAPLSPPEVPPELPDMPPVVRIHACLRLRTATLQMPRR
jgi:hypothetical protein